MKTIYEIFQELNIQYKLYEHPPFYTCEESGKWFGENTNEVSGKSKNLFLRNKKGNRHFLVVLESKKSVDMQALAKRLNESNLSFASEERLKKFLDLTPGAVSVLALIYEQARDIEVLFDADLLDYESIQCHPPARNDQTLVFSTKDLRRFMASIGNPLRIIALYSLLRRNDL